MGGWRRPGLGQLASREESAHVGVGADGLGFGPGPSPACSSCWRRPWPRPRPAEPLYVAGIPVDFILFALTLLGVALFHHHTLQVALTGLAAITLYKLGFTGFKYGTGLPGLAEHMSHEAVILSNLFLLLMGFALLSRHFEKSRVPDEMPRFLPDDWKGAFVLLVIVAVISSFLDNIAAALIGGTMAQQVFRGKVHIGYLAAIVAASNAGGSGSVVGDTTTTMMWIDGVSPLERARGLRRRQRRPGRVRHPGGDPAAALLAHREGRAGRPAHRMGARVHRGADPGGRDRLQRGRQPPLPRAARHPARDRPCRVGRHPGGGAAAAARLGRAARDLQGHDLPAGAGHLRLDDAGREAARSPPGRRRWAWASSRPCSTTSR